MHADTSESVSLGDIDSELQQVQAAKEEHRHALEKLDQDEVRLLGLAQALRDFLTSRRSKGASDAGEDLVIAPPDDSMTVDQVKDSSRGIVDRAVDALRTQEAQAPLGGVETWPLIQLMQERGFTSNAESVYLSVYGTLNRAAKRPNRPLVKIGNRWALREWYPNGVPPPPNIPATSGDSQEEEQPMLIEETAP